MANPQFDPYDWSSFYFGNITRQESCDILSNEEDGIFLLRDSSTLPGDYVLCVKESARESRISHYIINRVPQENDDVKYRIGEQVFPDIPSLLNFYKLHYLESTPLIRPAPRKLEKVIARFDFGGQEQDKDLPFRRGEVLYIVKKDSDDVSWWVARNANGQEGQIPANYVEPFTEKAAKELLSPKTSTTGVLSQPSSKPSASSLQRKLPAYALVKQARVPNAYDKTALRLEVGDVIKVTKMNANGTWEGELKGKTGCFPFNYIEWMDDSQQSHSGSNPSANGDLSRSAANGAS